MLNSSIDRASRSHGIIVRFTVAVRRFRRPERPDEPIRFVETEHTRRNICRYRPRLFELSLLLSNPCIHPLPWDGKGIAPFAVTLLSFLVDHLQQAQIID